MASEDGNEQGAGLHDKLIGVWPEFVDCRARLRTLLPFLATTIPPHASVLDLAAGLGYEAQALAEIGHDVTANEINSQLRKLAIDDRNLLNCGVRWTSCDWRRIACEMSGARFGALTLLGNSLCLLFGEEERKRALSQFFRLCNPGGIFVIDTRNFSYILGSRTSILSGNFRYSRRVIYCGQKVTGRPIAVSEHCVRFGYFGEGGFRHGTLDMAPLYLGEVIGACMGVGFRLMSVFSDLRFGVKESADFFTCVFRR
jgi:SAM-dependent methyltransferase